MFRGAATAVADAAPAARPGYRWACLILAGCWALPGIAFGVVAALSHTIPAPTPDGQAIPGWLWDGQTLVICAQPMAVLLLLPLLLGGFRYLRAGAAADWWSAAWAGLMMLAAALEAVLVAIVWNGLTNQPSGVSYPQPGRLSWAWLALGAGFAVTGAAVVWLLASAPRARRARRQACRAR